MYSSGSCNDSGTVIVVDLPCLNTDALTVQVQEDLSHQGDGPPDRPQEGHHRVLPRRGQVQRGAPHHWRPCPIAVLQAAAPPVLRWPGQALNCTALFIVYTFYAFLSSFSLKKFFKKYVYSAMIHTLMRLLSGLVSSKTSCKRCKVLIIVDEEKNLDNIFGHK